MRFRRFSPTTPRRLIGALLAMVIVAASVGATASALGAPADPAVPIRITEPADGIGIVRAGGDIGLSEDVRVTGSWAPVFGAARAVVNPAPVRSVGSRIGFPLPGEYYLELGAGRRIRVLVLPSSGSPSDDLQRLYEFFTANHVANSSDDAAFGQDADAYVRGFFTRDDLAPLLCGPTESFMQTLIAHRLGLPTRFVTGITAFRTSSTPDLRATTVHNVVEVYVPDKAAWTLVDPNNAFLPRWQSAEQIGDVVRASATRGERRPTGAVWDAIAGRLNLDPAVATRRPRDQYRPLSVAERHSGRFHDAIDVRTLQPMDAVAFGGGLLWNLDESSPNPALSRILPTYDAVVEEGWLDPELRQMALDTWVPREWTNVLFVDRTRMSSISRAAYATGDLSRFWRRSYAQMTRAAAG